MRILCNSGHSSVCGALRHPVSDGPWRSGSMLCKDVITNEEAHYGGMCGRGECGSRAVLFDLVVGVG